MSDARAVARAATLATSGLAVQGVSRLVYVIVVGRLASEETLASTSAALSLATLLALVAPTPLANAASRWLSMQRAAGASNRGMVGRLTAAGLASSIGLGVAAVPIQLVLGTALVPALCGGGAVLGYGLYSVARGAQLGLHGELRVLIADATSGLLALAGIAVVLVVGMEPLALLPIGVGYTLFALLAWPRRDADAGDPPSRDVGSFLLWNLLSGLSTNGLLLMSMLVVYATSEASSASQFAAAFSLATPVSMLGQAASQVLIARFAHHGGSRRERSRAARTFTIGFVVGTAPVFGLAALLAPIYLPLFYGPGFERSVGMLQLLLLPLYVFTAGLIPASFLLAAGRAREVALVSSIGFVIGLAVMLLSHDALGETGVTIGFLVGAVVIAIGAFACNARPARDGGPPHDLQVGSLP